MDSARSAARRCPLILLAVALLFVFPLAAPAQDNDSLTEQARQLAAQDQWQRIVELARANPTASADLDFYYGTALARLGQLDQARQAFRAGRRHWPQDERFPVELAGIAFKQKRYPAAAADLQTALKLAPHDSYAENFLGTVYFLQGNLEASLKYWNRRDKPYVVQVRAEPTPRLDPQLLDYAFAFAPASVLRLPDLLTSEARIAGLGVFSEYRFDLQARPDGNFDLIFHQRQHSGWRQNKWEALGLLLRGLPAQTVYPEFFNIGDKALNFKSMYRWDAQKRRFRADLTRPFDRDKRNLEIGMDLRSENWDIRNSFTGPAPLLGALNLRREAVSVNILSIVSGRWKWNAGAELSHRDYRSVIAGSALTPGLLSEGYQLKQTMEINAALWRIPEKRLNIQGGASSQLGRIWSDPSHSFEKLGASLQLHWFPKPVGDDYEMHEQIHVGRTWGTVPFDELSMLGIGGDNDLWMRGHLATRDGRKGSAPLGRNYFLSNWEDDKSIYRYGPLEVTLGPFLDVGKITDSSPGLGSGKWLWDLGPEIKARMFGAEVVVSYGKDLRSGNGAFYISLR